MLLSNTAQPYLFPASAFSLSILTPAQLAGKLWSVGSGLSEASHPMFVSATQLLNSLGLLPVSKLDSSGQHVTTVLVVPVPLYDFPPTVPTKLIPAALSAGSNFLLVNSPLRKKKSTNPPYLSLIFL